MLTKKRLLYMTGIICLLSLMTLALLFFVANEASAGGRPTVTVEGASSLSTDPGTQVTYQIKVENPFSSLF